MTQEVFLDLWKRREEIEIKQSIKYFLRRAVINNCLAYIRKNKRVSLNDEFQDHLMISDQEEVFEEDQDLHKMIPLMLQKLPERCREIFQLSRFEGLSHKEIAAHLNISTKTIENQITKAMKVLKSEFSKMGWLRILFFIFLIGDTLN